MSRAQHSLPDGDATADAPVRIGRRTIMDNASDYQKRGLMKMTMTPARADPYAMGDQTPDASVSTYADALRRAQLNREADNTYRNIELKRREAAESATQAVPAAEEPPQKAPKVKRRNRWGEAPVDAAPTPVRPGTGDATPAYGGLGDATPAHNRWDATPGPSADATPAYGAAATPAANRWDATPTPGRSLASVTPRRNRWDATPMDQAPSLAEPTPGRKNKSRCGLPGHTLEVLFHL
jgi:splicing factor 3B subunit 1